MRRETRPTTSMPPAHPSSTTASRALDAIRSDLLAIEHGIEPNLDRLLRQLSTLAEAAPLPGLESLGDLCERLVAFLDDLREDGAPVALEDIDLLLEQLPGDSALLPVISGPRLAQGPAPEVPGHAPEFRSSGIVHELRGPVVHLCLPPMHGPRESSRVLEDLAELWSHSPLELDWRLDLRAVDPVPAALVTELRRLQLAAEPELRRVALLGLGEQLRSVALLGGLSRHFELG